MIRRERGELIADCDECGESTEGVVGLSGGFRDFGLFVAEIKANGWRNRKDDGEWMNLCPDCARNPK